MQRVIFLLVLFISLTLQAMPHSILKQAQLESGPYYLDATDMFLEQAKEFYEKHGKQDLSELSPKKKVAVGETEEFWTTNVSNNQFEKVNAVLRAVTKHAYIYVQEGQKVSEETIRKFTKEFDENIYPNDRKYFGSEWKPGVDFDDRITMLFLDIKDGYNPQTSPGFVAGYFFPMNEYSTTVFEYSNEREMLYIDTNPADPASEMTFSVIAHEFQHMIHWNEDPKEEIWVNEACSQLAMRLCGYEHPNQIFAYVMNPKLALTAWAKDVMLANYGAVYLFNYYLATKYSSDDFSVFTRGLACNKARGLDGVAAALKLCGSSKSIDTVLSEWFIANAVNTKKGEYGYDKTLGVKIHPTKTHSGGTSDWQKEKILKHSADYIQFSVNTPVLPLFPTFIDKLTIRSEKPAEAVWGVNNWQKPLSEYIPQGSSSCLEGVKTPLSEKDGAYSAQIGPFRLVSKQEVKELNLVFRYADGTVSQEYSIPVTSLALDKNASDSLKIEFDGTSGSWWSSITGGSTRLKLYMACFDSFDLEKSLKVQELQLSSDSDVSVTVPGYGTVFDTVMLIPMNLTEKSGISYSYKATPVRSGRSFKNDLHTLKVLQRRAMEKLHGRDTEAYLNYVDRLESFKEVIGDAVFEDGISPDETPEAVLSKSDDEDTAHENIQYLAQKKQEIINSLTHLKIDPVWLEGQIKQILTLLEINLHFPHIPFPEGLALKNYNEDQARKYLEELLAEEATAKDRELLKRLTVAENYVEKSYNLSLLLAEDATGSLLKLVLLFCNSTDLISLALDKAENLPLIGPYSDQIKKLLIEKVTVLFQRIVAYAAQYLPSPYGGIVPFASEIMVKVLFHVMHITPSAAPYDVGFMKELAVKTAGKYVFSSLPAVGYVPLTQKHVDLTVDLVKKGEYTLTHKDSLNRVLEGNTSEYGKLSQSVSDVLEQAAKDRQFSGIASAVSDVAMITSAIDPTVISKVLAIAGKVASAGFISHAVGVAGCEYYRGIPDSNRRAVYLAYRPDSDPQKAVEVLPEMKENSLAPVMAGSARDILSNYAAQLEKVKNAVLKQDSNAMQKALPAFMESDSSVTRAAGDLSLLLAAEATKGSQRAETLLQDLQKQDLNRALFLAEVINQDYLAGMKMDNREILSKIQRLYEILKSSCQQLSQNIESYFSSPVHSTALVSVYADLQSFRLKSGSEIRITVTVKNIGSDSTGKSVFEVFPPHGITVTPQKKEIRLSQGEETEISLNVKISGSCDKGLNSFGFRVTGGNVPDSQNSLWVKVE